MKRHEDIRRQMQREGMNPAVLQITLDAERAKVIKRVVHDYSVVIATIMHDKLSFGQRRVKRILNEIMELYDSIEKNYINIADLEQVLKDEIDVEIN